MPYDGGGLGPPIDSIEIIPDPATITADGSVQFTAIFHYTDTGGAYPSGEDIDRTKEIIWLSSDEDVAMVNTGLSNGGLVFGRSAGTISVGAWYSYILLGPPPGPYDGTEPTKPYPGEPDNDAWITGWADLTVTTIAEPPPDPEGRFLLAFDDPTTEPYPTWTRLDSTPNLVTSHTIDRGRQYELDRTDTGRATVQIADTDGTLDPTNPDGPYYGKIQPLLQAALGRYDPVAEEWKLRFRGFVEDFTYQTDPSQKVNRLVVSLVDQFEILSGAEMQPGEFGNPPPDGSEGQIYYPHQRVEDRVARVLSDFGLALAFRVSLPGTVDVHSVIYSPGESPLTAVQDAADGEMPGVGNVFCDRRGRIAFHGKLAKFYPDTVAAEVGPGAWDYHTWQAGDGTAVNAAPTTTAQIRAFGFNRGVSKIINSATAYPTGTQDTDIPGQLVVDATSVGRYGIRSWSATDLLTSTSRLDDATALVETKRFASFQTSNYKDPQNRVQDVTFRSLHPDDPRAAANWQLLTGVDIADLVTLTVALPGGGGFTETEYFVEGVHEEANPLTPGYDDVTLRLDLSPRAYFATNPWPAPDSFAVVAR